MRLESVSKATVMISQRGMRSVWLSVTNVAARQTRFRRFAQSVWPLPAVVSAWHELCSHTISGAARQVVVCSLCMFSLSNRWNQSNNNQMSNARDG